MIETELLTFPLEGKDKFIAEMKTFNARHKARRLFAVALNAVVSQRP